MVCKDYSEDLTAYLDGELSPSRASEIAAHIRTCRPCSDELSELRRTGDFIGAHSVTLEPRPEMWNNLRARIPVRPEVRGYPDWFQTWLGNRRLAALGSLVATAALVLGLWGYIAHRESQRSLERYMREYVQQRETMDGRLDNPFVVSQQISFDNPFRSGEQ
jgi:anti-sigma factor RsiW